MLHHLTLITDCGSTFVVATAGSVSISGGKLFLGSGTGNYIRYDVKGNADFTQTGAIKFKLTPNYSGTPQVLILDLIGIGEIAKIANRYLFASSFIHLVI